MSQLIIYGYYLDDALKKSIKLGSTTSIDQGYGTLNSQQYSYLTKPFTLKDIRNSRLDAIDNKAAYGDSGIVFDNGKLPEDLFTGVGDEVLQRLLNVIERCAYQNTAEDSAIEYQLTSNVNIYQGYVENSFMHGVDSSEVEVTTFDKNNVSLTVYNWISFSFILKDETIVKFHIWLSNAAFDSDYPYTTITAVVPPCALDLLTNPGRLVATLNIDVLQATSNFIFSESKEVAKLIRDHTGVYSFKTKYVIDPQRNIQIAFALPYCGPTEPSSLECRKVIREYLFAQTQMTEEQLKELFPELFISARFYLAPLWDYYEQFTDGLVYTSINSLQKYSEYLSKVFKDIEEEYRTKYCEILENGHLKTPTLSVPDELNEKFFSVRSMHPTYQDYSTLSVGWKYMTAPTQEFAGKFMRCLKVLNGEETSTEFLKIDVDGISYLSFTSGDAEYLIMFKDSFYRLIGKEIGQ